jgi:hypothetical protein
VTTGGQLRARVSSRLVLRPLQTRADGSHLAKVYPRASARNPDRQGLVVQIWIQRDGTEHGIATDLLDAGVPKEHIVLGFKPPEVRKYTDFAVA